MIWWMFAAVLAYFVKGLCGFANTLVFTSVLSFTNNNVSISPIELILGYPSNAILVYKERKSIEWKICLPIAALVLLGCIPGAFFLKSADTGFVKLVFGFVIVGIGLEMLLREIQQKKSKQSKVLLVTIGLLSGLLCGLYGIGALLSAYMGRVTEDSHSFKANLCMVFLAENTFRLILYTAWGILTPEIFKQALFLAPAMLLGLGLGMASVKRMDERIVKRIVILMLILSGAVLIFQNI